MYGKGDETIMTGRRPPTLKPETYDGSTRAFMPLSGLLKIGIRKKKGFNLISEF